MQNWQILEAFAGILIYQLVVDTLVQALTFVVAEILQLEVNKCGTLEEVVVVEEVVVEAVEAAEAVGAVAAVEEASKYV